MTPHPRTPSPDDAPGDALGDALGRRMAEAFAAARDVQVPPDVLAGARARIAAEASARPASDRRALAPAPNRPAARPQRPDASRARRALWPGALAALALGLVLAWGLLQPSPGPAPGLVAEGPPSAETPPEALEHAAPSPARPGSPEPLTGVSPGPPPQASPPARPVPRPLRATPQAASPESTPPQNIAQASPEATPEAADSPEAARVRDEVLLAFRLFSETRERAEALVAGEIAAATSPATRALTP